MTDLNNTNELNNELTTLDAPAAGTIVAAVKKSSKPKDYVTKENLTQEALKEFLELREDNLFYWVKPTVRSLAGDFAGSISPLNDKYVIVFKGTSYNAVALRQFYNEGTWPAAAVRQPKVDAEGNPIVKEAKAPRVARVAPVFTPEQREAAKKAHQEKLASIAAVQAAKKASEAAKVSETEVVAQAPSDVNDSNADTSDISEF